MIRYFTEREYGERPRTIDVIDEWLWGGLYGLVDTHIEDGSFGYRFPEPMSRRQGTVWMRQLYLRPDAPRGSAIDRVASFAHRFA